MNSEGEMWAVAFQLPQPKCISVVAIFAVGYMHAIVSSSPINNRDEKQLYWVDAHTDVIYKSNPDGSNRQEVKQFMKTAHAFGITITQGLYQCIMHVLWKI